MYYLETPVGVPGVEACPSRPAVDCIINDNHDYLLEFLEGLAVPERSATIQDWDTAGGVYLDYIRVTKTLQDVQQVPFMTEAFFRKDAFKDRQKYETQR